MVKQHYLYYILIALISISICSCGNLSNSKLEVIIYNDTIQIEPSPKSKHDLPQGLAYGKIIPPVFPDSMKAERNLLSQVASYNSALLHGDVNTCKKYLYPDAFKYCRKYYPGFPDEEVMNEFFKDTSGDLQNALIKWQEMGVDLNIVVSNLERKIICGNDIIIVFNVLSNQCSDNVYIHTTDEDKTIGISQNGGKNFWFMNNHDDLPTILAMHYPQEVINAVMGY